MRATQPAPEGVGYVSAQKRLVRADRDAGSSIASTLSIAPQGRTHDADALWIDEQGAP